MPVVIFSFRRSHLCQVQQLLFFFIFFDWSYIFFFCVYKILKKMIYCESHILLVTEEIWKKKNIAILLRKYSKSQIFFCWTTQFLLLRCIIYSFSWSSSYFSLTTLPAFLFSCVYFFLHNCEAEKIKRRNFIAINV